MHSGNTTSSAPCLTASSTYCVANAMLWSKSPKRASVWTAAARKRRFVMLVSIFRRLIELVPFDFPPEAVEAMAFQLDESLAGGDAEVARQRKIHRNNSRSSRRSTRQQHDSSASCM